MAMVAFFIFPDKVPESLASEGRVNSREELNFVASLGLGFL